MNAIICLDPEHRILEWNGAAERLLERAAARVIDRDSTDLEGGRETILVVEDEDSVRHLTVRMLKSLGYKVLQARHGAEALMICKEYAEPIDLVFTDVVMPRMSGAELADAIQEARLPLKVLFTSGFSEDVLERHGVRYSGSNFLLKPYTRATLARCIRQALDEAALPV